MASPDVHSPRRATGERSWKGGLRVLFLLGAIVFTVHSVTAGTYFLYRDKPLRLMDPQRFAPSPQRIRPFDYRKEYTPRQMFQREQYTKSAPPLDPRVKSTTSFSLDFEEFLLECESSIRAFMIRGREAGVSGYITLRDTTQVTKTVSGRGTVSGESGAAMNRGLLRLSKFRGPVTIAADGGEMQTAPEDMRLMLDGLARAVKRNTPIEARIDSMVSLGSPGLRNIPFLLLPFAQEPRLSASEKNHLRQYLRGGGFALVYCKPLSRPEDILSRILPVGGPEEARVKPVPPGHPLYDSCFELSDGTASGPGTSPPEAAPVGVWFKDRLAAVCLARKSGMWTERTSETELKLWVNLVVFALTQPGGIAMDGAEGAAGPR